MKSSETVVRRIVRCVPERPDAHRYLLEIGFGDSPERSPRLAVVLKNPSTATAARSDPTVGKVEAWARRRGFASVRIVNLFALRSTAPAGLNDHDYDWAVGPQNDTFIRSAAIGADVMVAAWGNANGIHPERYRRRVGEVLQLLATLAGPLKTVGPLTRVGHPRHGLLWNGGLELRDWLGFVGPNNSDKMQAFRVGSTAR